MCCIDSNSQSLEEGKSRLPCAGQGSVGAWRGFTATHADIKPILYNKTHWISLTRDQIYQTSRLTIT